MTKKHQAVSFFVILALVSWTFIVPVLSAESSTNYERLFSFHVYVGKFRILRKLYVSVLPSLYEYYRGRSHGLPSLDCYLKFVTPQAVKPIAKAIRDAIQSNMYSDEQFADAVLTIIQQFEYQECGIKYPVETIVDGFGDCDALSVLAASIMVAGGLDVILLYYDDVIPKHMNVGVCLPYTPAYHTWWLPLTYYEYAGKKYWVAECTPLWKWKVGDQPQSFLNSKPKVIPVNNLEGEQAPASIYASLDRSSRKISHLSITVSEVLNSNNGSVIKLSGSISPKIENASITLYFSNGGTSWKAIQTEATDFNGSYSFKLRFSESGTYYLRASWRGNSELAGSDSETLILLFSPPRKLEAEIEDWINSGDPQLRAQRAILHRLLWCRQRKNFVKMIGSGRNLILSYDFYLLGGNSSDKQEIGLIVKGGNTTYTITTLGNALYAIKELNDDTTMLAKVPLHLIENRWYRIVMTAIGGRVTVAVTDKSGRPFGGLEFSYEGLGELKCGIYIKNYEFLIIKNVNFRIFNGQNSELPKSSADPLTLLNLHLSYVLAILAATAISLSIIFIKRKL